MENPFGGWGGGLGAPWWCVRKRGLPRGGAYGLFSDGLPQAV
ncbi:hypothetical protein [Bergeriella denitrificans]|nr:hypothetical protein [Bergeriella denitrificans]